MQQHHAPRDCYSEWNKWDTEGEISYFLYDIPYMHNIKRNDTNQLITKEKQTHPLQEQVYGCQGRRMWRKDS